MKNKTVYIALSADTLHHGHINLVNEAKKHGKVIAGLLTDRAIHGHKKLPYLTYEQRKKILQSINGISKVISQNEWSYHHNLKTLKPDFFIHGDDWLTNGEIENKYKAIKVLDSYGGKLIEIPHTKGVSTGMLLKDQLKIATTPEIRIKSLSRLIETEKLIRIVEVHSPFSALIVENLKIKHKDKIKFFDGFWSSSLCDSIHMGKPDNEVLDLTHRLSNINNIFEISTKPLILDLDTGGKKEHLALNIKRIERLGISAIIIEDKVGLKKNSLFGDKANQKQETIKNFCEKINIVKKYKTSKDLLLISRIESLVLKNGMKDAVDRAKKYVEAGSDGIMIHSANKNPDEIIEFAKKFRKIYKKVPLISVPSSYSTIYEVKLKKSGFNIVIYANQITRSIYKPIKNTLENILRHERSYEAEKKMLNIKEIINLIPSDF